MSAAPVGTGPARRLVMWVARSFGVRNRRRKWKSIKALIDTQGVRSALVVGMSGADYKGEDLIENAVQSTISFTVVCGLMQSADVGFRRYVVCDALALPFRDQAFDLIVSNAVIEHVGEAENQSRFVAEHHRAGVSWVMTTPNRWFPVEPHTGVVFRHWSANWRRKQTAFTKLLSPREFRALLPAGAGVRGTSVSPTLLALGGRSRGSSAGGKHRHHTETR